MLNALAGVYIERQRSSGKLQAADSHINHWNNELKHRRAVANKNCGAVSAVGWVSARPAHFSIAVVPLLHLSWLSSLLVSDRPWGWKERFGCGAKEGKEMRTRKKVAAADEFGWLLLSASFVGRTGLFIKISNFWIRWNEQKLQKSHCLRSQLLQVTIFRKFSNLII